MIETIKNILNQLKGECDFNIRLLRYKNSENSENSENSFEFFPIVLDERSRNNYKNRVVERNIKSNKSILNNDLVEDYTGENTYINLVKVHKEFINHNFMSFINAIRENDYEGNWANYKDGYVLQIGSNYFISLTSSIKLYKNISKMGRNNEFTEWNEPFLQLNDKFDVFIINDNVYFSSAKGEELFNMQRTFENLCNQHLQEIEDSKIVSNIKQLREFSLKKRYAKYYINFNKDKLVYIENKNNMKKIAKKFNIRLIQAKIDTSDDESLKNFVKFICNKGMIDPCDSSPVEVSNAKRW